MIKSIVVFGAFVFLSVFNAGAMTTLQIQHYGIYPQVGRDNFAGYIRANNRAALVLNLVQLASTAIWQRKLQSEMATSGYDEAKTHLLIRTDWVRTLAFLAQAGIAMTIVVRALSGRVVA